MNAPFIHKPTNPESVPPVTSLSKSHTKPVLPLPSIIPGPGATPLETSSAAQNPRELFQRANPKVFTLPCLTFPVESPLMALSFLPAPLCLLTTLVLPPWPYLPCGDLLSLCSVSIINLFLLGIVLVSSCSPTGFTPSYPTPTFLGQVGMIVLTQKSLCLLGPEHRSHSQHPLSHPVFWAFCVHCLWEGGT